MKRKFGTLEDSSNEEAEDTQARIAQLEECIEEIKKAEMVAIDMEFSGLFTVRKKPKSAEDYYTHCADDVPKFLAFQFGVCTARRDAGDLSKWVLSPFNFHLFPRRRRVFSSDSLSLKWLLDQGFDLNRCIREGYDYKDMSSLHEGFDPSTEKLKMAGAQRIVDAIIEHTKPLIVHNGTLDVLHLYDKFIGNLPPTLPIFAGLIREYFIDGIYDTKRLAEEGRTHIFRMCDSSRGATSLETLRYHLSGRQSKLSLDINLDLRAIKAGNMKGYHLWVPGAQRATGISPADLATNKSHEAGFDAMMTLQVFLLQLEWISSAGDAGSQMPIPVNWKDLEVVRRVRNSLELVGIPPGKICLEDYEGTNILSELASGTKREERKSPSEPEKGSGDDVSVGSALLINLNVPPPPPPPPPLSPRISKQRNPAPSPYPNKPKNQAKVARAERGSNGTFRNLQYVCTDEPEDDKSQSGLSPSAT